MENIAAVKPILSCCSLVAISGNKTYGWSVVRQSLVFSLILLSDLLEYKISKFTRMWHECVYRSNFWKILP